MPVAATLLSLLALLSLLTGPPGLPGLDVSAWAGTTQVVTVRNEHGGQTIRTVYAATDKEFHDAGLEAGLTVYDGDGNMVRKEVTCTQDRTYITYETAIILTFAPGTDAGDRPVSREVRYAPDSPVSFGIARKIDYFNANGTSLRTEVYSTPQAIVSDGCVRGVFHRDSEGHLTSIEYLFSDTMADKIGISIRIDIYDHNQTPVRTEFYDKSGNLIAKQDN